MASRNSPRALLWALLAAVLIGFLFGWVARIWYKPSAESRARDAAEEIRERVRRATH